MQVFLLFCKQSLFLALNIYTSLCLPVHSDVFSSVSLFFINNCAEWRKTLWNNSFSKFVTFPSQSNLETSIDQFPTNPTILFYLITTGSHCVPLPPTTGFPVLPSHLITRLNISFAFLSLWQTIM